MLPLSLPLCSRLHPQRLRRQRQLQGQGQRQGQRQGLQGQLLLQQNTSLNAPLSPETTPYLLQQAM